ncbi:hypothetical protein B9Z55_019231 [Caenorhabditis nigoni]|uniref:G-protein coupled receptors family 1 profile domain-containing protein n=1 Tax=Caenorhabditis nigoni TaxID=1611254 RepID=A0A2G5THI0_9PELO|nr:hypothetical protein B9Z55_019231 [Caenorhabditis nigoni]
MISAIPPPLIPIALFYFLCAIVSLIGNMIMIICFFRERKFNSPCHYMITLACAADMLHLCGHFVFNFQLFYDGPGSQELCFWLLLPSCIGLAISGPLLLSMGIDRFLACQCPMVYRQLCSRPAMYLLLQLFFPIIHTVYLNVSSFVQRDPKTMVICQVPLAMSGDSFEKFNQGGLIINIGVVIVYFVTFLKLRRLAGSATHLKVVFRSILYTVIFVILGWSTVTMMNIASIHLVEDIDTVHILMIYAGIGLNMACASNIFVFYAINSEYRAAIRKLFGKSVPIKIHPSTSMFASTARGNTVTKF